ncbi:multicomponent Na+:H+ antiporter subunit C [Peptoclostridium litorale DSM 5388]|uniref:NADH-ubiquinone oxidoreductase, chain 4L n=1 Tax=Peptoclostridium litorale DSM 5388 TaxID=1121324 RepID=A0A069RGN2_PEPLI|nr:cation:proton antiporter subunit C [Peptoclostridium litorale]KDR96184.1 NADH-ubiquinone oxidoreductase, chain 4L [Peptoclostridium litorale DSM 5388]SIO13134.1 multicomponent Na+:H+ antiporter subunit C [Peptoclostridium litorale DSM 5388]
MEIYFSSLVIIIGLYGLCNSKNLIKSVVCLNISQAGIILLFLGIVHSKGDSIPIVGTIGASFVDPLPQALMITAIVIGASVTSLALMISIKLFHEYGTLEWADLFRKGKI